LAEGVKRGKKVQKLQNAKTQGDMMGKRKVDKGQTREKVVDYTHKSSKRLNIPIAG
jgi:hypothetical protein